MRQLIYTGCVICGTEKDLEVLLQAKDIIEKNGIDDHVLEFSQPHCMGGATYTVTSLKELDKKYIGYRGYADYGQVKKYINSIKRSINKKRYDEKKKSPK